MKGWPKAFYHLRHSRKCSPLLSTLSQPHCFSMRGRNSCNGYISPFSNARFRGARLLCNVVQNLFITLVPLKTKLQSINNSLTHTHSSPDPCQPPRMPQYPPQIPHVAGKTGGRAGWIAAPGPEGGIALPMTGPLERPRPIFLRPLSGDKYCTVFIDYLRFELFIY